MSYLLEFPPTTLPLPEDILSPPYVIFGIKGASVVDILPPRIPLKAVLHFVPKLAEYVLPEPQNLPPAVAKGMLTMPHVGIDIRLDIGNASFQRIIWKVLQSAGRTIPREAFQHQPNLVTAISIYRSWTLLELHPAGLDAVMLHIQTHLMTGPAISLTQLQWLWEYLPHTSEAQDLAADNFVRSFIDLMYAPSEAADLQNWYCTDAERLSVFQKAESRYPAYGKTLVAMVEMDRMEIDNDTAEQAIEKTEEEERRARVEAELVAAVKAENEKRLAEWLEETARDGAEGSEGKRQGDGLEYLAPRVYE